MFFKKKGEDPWEYEPEKPLRPAEPGPEDKDNAPNMMDELRNWNEERKEKKRQRETPPPPMTCPWCGQEMEVGTIAGNQYGLYWRPGWPPKWIQPESGDAIRMDHEGTILLRYKTVYFCRTCRRMTLEIPEEELPKPLTPEEAAARAEEQRQQEAQRKISRGLQG